MWEICTLGELNSAVFYLPHFCLLGSFPYPCISSGKLLSHLRTGNRLTCPENCSAQLLVLVIIRMIFADFSQVQDNVFVLARRSGESPCVQPSYTATGQNA